MSVLQPVRLFSSGHLGLSAEGNREDRDPHLAAIGQNQRRRRRLNGGEQDIVGRFDLAFDCLALGIAGVLEPIAAGLIRHAKAQAAFPFKTSE